MFFAKAAMAAEQNRKTPLELVQRVTEKAKFFKIAASSACRAAAINVMAQAKSSPTLARAVPERGVLKTSSASRFAFLRELIPE